MLSDPLVLPEDDFADARFDRDVGTSSRTLLLILSTPRSGSTLACDLLHQAGVCTAHEYFQPYQIRPAMTHRWGLADEDDAGYCAALARYRASRSGACGFCRPRTDPSAAVCGAGASSCVPFFTKVSRPITISS